VTIVIGYYEVDPDNRSNFIAARHDQMRAVRAKEGCQEFAFCADPLNAGRVILVEQWASRESLDRHLESSRSESKPPGMPAPTAPPNIVFYEVAGTEPYKPS
jgi:quinol monooxygenase YgiN